MSALPTSTSISQANVFWMRHDGFIGGYMHAVGGHAEEDFPGEYRTEEVLHARQAGFQNGCFERQALLTRWADHPGWLADPWSHREVFVDAEQAFATWLVAIGSGADQRR